MRIGPEAYRVLNQFRSVAEVGGHVLISGDTGSGKTSLVRPLVQPRIERGGCVVMFVTKPTPDSTIVKDFGLADGWVRWTKMKKRPRPHEQKILLWPDLKKMDPLESREHQREIFGEALNLLYRYPGWTIINDEALYITNPEYLGLGKLWGLHNFHARSMGNTLYTLTQRPSHLPVIVYGSTSHAFVGRTSEPADLKRLSELNSHTSSKATAEHMRVLGRHDFLWIRKNDPRPPTVLNLAR